MLSAIPVPDRKVDSIAFFSLQGNSLINDVNRLVALDPAGVPDLTSIYLADHGYLISGLFLSPYIGVHLPAENRMTVLDRDWTVRMLDAEILDGCECRSHPAGQDKSQA